MPRIYYAGSHSTGKSVLAATTAEEFGLPLIDEVSRLELARGKHKLATIRADLKACRKFQETVWKQQLAIEKAHGNNYVSDRTFDNLAYWLSYAPGAYEIIQSREFARYLNQVRSKESIVFLVRPERSMIEADGVRTTAELNFGEMCRIDGMVETLLASNGVNFVPIRGDVLQDRMRVIRAALRGLGLFPKSQTT
jgi:nicotinamide riboside kinase